MISKSRREQGGFTGDKIILKQLAEGVSRKRVGIRPEGRIIARGGVTITAHGENTPVGEVTSGCFAPTLQSPIAIGYVATPYIEEGTMLDLIIRGKSHTAQVAALPFIKPGYYRGP